MSEKLGNLVYATVEAILNGDPKQITRIVKEELENVEENELKLIRNEFVRYLLENWPFRRKRSSNKANTQKKFYLYQYFVDKLLGNDVLPEFNFPLAVESEEMNEIFSEAMYIADFFQTHGDFIGTKLKFTVNDLIRGLSTGSEGYSTFTGYVLRDLVQFLRDYKFKTSRTISVYLRYVPQIDLLNAQYIANILLAKKAIKANLNDSDATDGTNENDAADLFYESSPKYQVTVLVNLINHIIELPSFEERMTLSREQGTEIAVKLGNDHSHRFYFLFPHQKGIFLSPPMFTELVGLPMPTIMGLTENTEALMGILYQRYGKSDPVLNSWRRIFTTTQYNDVRLTLRSTDHTKKLQHELGRRIFNFQSYLVASEDPVSYQPVDCLEMAKAKLFDFFKMVSERVFVFSEPPEGDTYDYDTIQNTQQLHDYLAEVIDEKLPWYTFKTEKHPINKFSDPKSSLSLPKMAVCLEYVTNNPDFYITNLTKQTCTVCRKPPKESNPFTKCADCEKFFHFTCGVDVMKEKGKKKKLDCEYLTDYEWECFRCEFLRTRLDVIDERYLHLVEQDIGKKLFNGFRKTAESAKHKSELENNMKTAFKMAAKTLTKKDRSLEKLIHMSVECFGNEFDLETYVNSKVQKDIAKEQRDEEAARLRRAEEIQLARERANEERELRKRKRNIFAGIGSSYPENYLYPKRENTRRLRRSFEEPSTSDWSRS